MFAVATSISIYTHYYLFFSTFAIGLFVLYWLVKNYGKQWSAYRYAITVYALVFISYIPWIKTFLFQFGQVQNNYWIPKIGTWSIPLTVWELLTGTGGDSTKKPTEILFSLGVLFTIYMLYRVIKKEHSQNKWLVVFGLVVPFLGAVALSLKQSIFLDRYFVFAGLFYTVAVAIFLKNIGLAWLKHTLLAVLVLVSVLNWAYYWKDLNPDARPGLAAAASYLALNVKPQDKLDIGSSFEFFNFKYYNQTGVPALLYTPGIAHISDLPHYSGTALLNDNDLIQNLNANTKPGDTAWLLWTNSFGGSKPNVPANWVEQSEQNWADVRPYVGTYIYASKYLVK